MESTYVYYPAKRVYKILSTADLTKKGYKILTDENNDMSLIIEKKSLFQKKHLFEIKIISVRENISNFTVHEINTSIPTEKMEKELMQFLLRMF